MNTLNPDPTYDNSIYSDTIIAAPDGLVPCDLINNIGTVNNIYIVNDNH